MDIRTVETRTAYDAALAAILRGRRAELNMSRQALAEASGIPANTFRWYLAETPRPMPVTAFVALVSALDLDFGHVVAEAMARVASTTGD